MTYAQSGLIEANDYNQRANGNTLGANVNVMYLWGTGAGDRGLGQSANNLSNVSAATTVTATQWSALLSNVNKMASHQGTATSIPASGPTAGDTIAFISNLDTTITNLNTNYGNATAVGTEIVTFTGTTARTTNWGTAGSSLLTFTHTVTFADSNSARYFFNAGGYVRLRCSKSSTGNFGDPEWNDLASTLMSELRFTGGTRTQTIAGQEYTGTTRIGGTGTPGTNLTTTGFYDLTTTPVIVYQQNADTSPYTNNYIRVSLSVNSNASPSVMTVTTEWNSADGDTNSGGTDTTSPFSSFGTGPATLITVVPPSTTHIASTWGTPTIAASVTAA
jgi:hypothetical protein